MAQVVRLPQPWLRTAVQTTARLSMPRPAIIAAGHRGFSTSGPRLRQARQEDSKKYIAKMYEKAKMARIEQNSAMLMPLTLVAPPLSRYPRNVKEFFHMGWSVFKNRVQALGGLLGQKFVSMEGITSRPKYKARKRSSIPIAKALHVQMNEAFAAGDTATLRRVCIPDIARRYIEAIAARPKGRRVEWQLVKYEQTMRYPRLADWRVSMLPGQDGMRLIQQAVVSIASEQRTAQFDDLNRRVMIEGSERVRHLVEHVVIQSEVNQKTWESTPWRIWGTISEATYESYMRDKTLFESVSDDQMIDQIKR